MYICIVCVTGDVQSLSPTIFGRGLCIRATPLVTVVDMANGQHRNSLLTSSLQLSYPCLSSEFLMYLVLEIVYSTLNVEDRDM
jgi:hypothetical protein